MEEIASTLVSNGNSATVEEKFEAALNVIKSLPKNGSYKPDPRMMLKFYSYYKQATEGPCTKAKPWAWDIINKAKWEAWSKLGEMPKKKAMEEYVENLKLVMIETPPPTDDQIVEVLPATENVQSFIQILGDFYELVELDPPDQFKKHRKPVTSTPHRNRHPTLLGEHNGAHVKMNGDDPEDSPDSENEVNGISMNGHGDVPPINGETPPDEEDESDQEDERKSDSEDEFCDTAEEIQTSGDSPMHSYTVVNNDGQTEGLSKSGSISTLDSTMDGESANRDESCPTSPSVNVRTRGGEHGTRGSDRSSSQLQRGTGSNHTGTSSGIPLQRGMSDTVHGVGSSGGAGGGRGPPYSYSEVQDQIATTLFQLQQDMNSVLNRLSILEALTVGQQARRVRTMSGDSTSSYGSPRLASRAKNVTPSWWPFTELSPKTVFFIISWPFVARWIMHIVSKRRLKR